jgi:hypothetical protein
MADVWIGLDLGQHTDFAAAAVVRRSMTFDPVTGHPERNSAGFALYKFEVMAIKRYPLGTPYTGIVQHVVGQVRRPELGRRPRLVVDATGCGGPVVEMFRTALARLPHVEVHSVVITAGSSWRPVARWSWHVSKVELVSAIRAALESGRLKVPARLEHADTLRRELADFRVKITAAANETFSAREGQHDDIVLSVCLPIWLSGLRTMELIPDPDWLLPGEQRAVGAEIAAIEREEVEAVEAERHGYRVTKEARQVARHADIDDDHWWPDSPRSTAVMELLVEAADPALLDERVQGLAAPDVEIEIERDDAGRYARHPSSDGVGAWRLLCGQGSGNYLASVIGYQGWGKVLSKRRL